MFKDLIDHSHTVLMSVCSQEMGECIFGDVALIVIGQGGAKNESKKMGVASRLGSFHRKTLGGGFLSILVAYEMAVLNWFVRGISHHICCKKFGWCVTWRSFRHGEKRRVSRETVRLQAK